MREDEKKEKKFLVNREKPKMNKLTTTNRET